MRKQAKWRVLRFTSKQTMDDIPVQTLPTGMPWLIFYYCLYIYKGKTWTPLLNLNVYSAQCLRWGTATSKNTMRSSFQHCRNAALSSCLITHSHCRCQENPVWPPHSSRTAPTEKSEDLEQQQTGVATAALVSLNSPPISMSFSVLRTSYKDFGGPLAWKTWWDSQCMHTQDWSALHVDGDVPDGCAVDGPAPDGNHALVMMG